MLNFYQKKTFIGAENVYVHLIDRYYTNEPQLWDASTLKQRLPEQTPSALSYSAKKYQT